MSLRPYQKEGIDKIFREWRSGKKSVLFQMPTGTGKTVLFNEIVKRGQKEDRNILIVVHRKELVEQITGMLNKIGVPNSIIMANIKSDYSKLVQVASIQTFTRRNPPKANLIIIDEAHHATANSYRNLWDYYKDAKFLGVTATPIRMSGQGFDDLFDILITSNSIKEFIIDGYLSRIRQFVGSNPDLSKVKISKGDYESRMLSALMQKDSIMASLTETYRKHAWGKSTIVFAVNIEHSKYIVDNFRKIGIKSEHIDSNTPRDIREKVLKQFREKEIQLVSNVEIITEGFDFPECEVVQLARPTQSLALYLQMVGRVMRIAPGKNEGIILDNAGLWMEHGLAIKDRNWTLSGKKRKRGKKNLEPIGVVAFDPENKIINPKRKFPDEVNGLELFEIKEEHLRLLKFEEFFNQSTRKGGSLLRHYHKYKEYLEEEFEMEMTKVEFEYIKKRLDHQNVIKFGGENYKPGFWFHQEKEMKEKWGGMLQIPVPKVYVQSGPSPKSWKGYKEESKFRNELEDDFERNYGWDDGDEDEQFKDFEVFYFNSSGEKMDVPTVFVGITESSLTEQFYEQHPGCSIDRYCEI